MNTMTLPQAAEACLNHRAAWLSKRAEYQGMSSGTAEAKKEELRKAAVKYIRSHEVAQRISIRNRLDEFMQLHGVDLAAALAPELMHIRSLPELLQHRALDRSAHYLRDALSVWLAAGEDIPYAAQDSAILTAIGFRPDAAAREDIQQQ